MVGCWNESSSVVENKILLECLFTEHARSHTRYTTTSEMKAADRSSKQLCAALLPAHDIVPVKWSEAAVKRYG